jgi:formiminotetrahydrofolate cyclodeaminase
LGAALVEMVAGLTLGKKKYADVEAAMQAIQLRAKCCKSCQAVY